MVDISYIVLVNVIVLWLFFHVLNQESSNISNKKHESPQTTVQPEQKVAQIKMPTMHEVKQNFRHYDIPEYAVICGAAMFLIAVL